MRLGRVAWLCLAIAGCAAVVVALHGRFALAPAPAPSPVPTEPLLVVDSFKREYGSPCVRARLENHSATPIFHLSTFGRPVLWAYYSRDGVHWENPTPGWVGCGVGYYAATLKPGESSPTRGCNVTPLYDPWPRLARFGTAYFDGSEDDWSDGRVVWSDLYRIEDGQDPVLVPRHSSPKVYSPPWPTVTACRRIDDLARYDRLVQVALTFESSSREATVPTPWSQACPAQLSLRYRHTDGEDVFITHSHLKVDDAWPDWTKGPDGRYELRLEQEFKVPARATALAVGVPFQATKGDGVFFKRIWSDLADPRTKRP